MKHSGFFAFLYGVVGAGCGWIFLSRWWFVLSAFLLAFLFGQRQWNKKEKSRAEERERDHFRLFLESFSARLEAGSNVLHAMKFAVDQMIENSNGSASLFLKGMIAVLDHHQNGESLVQGLDQFVLVTRDPLIVSFLESLRVGLHQGSDLSRLSSQYLLILIEEETLAENRRASLDRSKREQTLLFCMPVLLMAAMRFSGLLPDQDRWIDYLVRFASGTLFVIAWFWSERILKTSGLKERGKR